MPKKKNRPSRSVSLFLTKSKRALSRRGRYRREARRHLIEQLEDRRVLAVASVPDQLLQTGGEAVLLAPGFFTPGTSADLVSVTKNGQVDVTPNGDDNTWGSPVTTAVEGPVLGGETGLLNADAFDDLLLVTANRVDVLVSDQGGGWTNSQSLELGGVLDASNHPVVEPTLGYLSGDLRPDFFVPLPQSDQVAIYYGSSEGPFSSAVYLSDGLDAPQVVAVGNVIGDANADLVVGLEDGSLVFFEGGSEGSLTWRSDLAYSTQAGTIVSLEIQDLDADGIAEVVFAGNQAAGFLSQTSDPNTSAPIVNGSFASGLSGWQVESVGAPLGEVAGRINANSGFAQFTENHSFLTSLSQALVIPSGAQTLEFDLLSLGLDPDRDGTIPDAFEVSLVDADSNSLVPTHRPGSTAFVNYVAGESVSPAAGVSVNGSTVSLDISGVNAGSQATLIFDLIGNPNGSRSTVSIDDVRVTPEPARQDGFDTTQLTGGFTALSDLAVGDVDGDGFIDVVLSDPAQSTLVVLNGDASGNFTRDDLSTSDFGVPDRLTLGPFTSPDDTLDIAASVAGQSALLTPLVSDLTVPTVQLLSPSIAQPIVLTATEDASAVLGTLLFQFSEPMFLGTPNQAGAANNPESYLLYNFGPDGLDDGGTGDDVVFPVLSADYDQGSDQVAVTVDPVSLSNPGLAAGSMYAILIAGEDPSSGLRDLAGNRLDGGQDVRSSFVLERTPILSGLTPVDASEGSEVMLSTTLLHNNFDRTYSATIEWGDGTSTEIQGQGDFPSEPFEGAHVYADNGNYQVILTVDDGTGVVLQELATFAISNVAPTLTAISPLNAVEGVATVYTLATFSDPGFSDPVAGSLETFVATVDWGDGSPTETFEVNASNGGPGIPTTGTVTATHTYADDGAYTPVVTLSDDDAGTGSVQPRVEIENVPPVLEDLATLGGDEGAFLTFGFSASDAGGDAVAATIDWGDGSTSPASGVLVGTDWQFEAVHAYPDNGDYAIVVTIDDGTDFVQDTTTASIASQAPIVLVDNQLGLVGIPLELEGIAITDPAFPSAVSDETFTATINWGDGSPTETIAVTNLIPGAPGVPTTASVAGAHVYAATGVYTAIITVVDDDGATASESFNVGINDPNVGKGAWLPTINFERDAQGRRLSPGQILGEQWADWGVHVSTTEPFDHPAMLFDSANPTGGDVDLGAPNITFGGPGVGSGGESGASHENAEFLGNVLILSEDGDASDPDDNAAGGTLVFTFDYPVMLDDVRVLDIDHGETAKFRVFDADDSFVSETVLSGAGDNSFQTATLNASRVGRLEVEFSRSGAVSDLIFCRDLTADGTIQVSGPAGVLEGTPYELSLISNGNAIDAWTVHWGDGTTDTFGADQTLATHTFADGPFAAEIYVTATSEDDHSVYAATLQVVVVENVVPSLTISGESQVLVDAEYELALNAVDPGQDEISSWLIDWGDGSQFEFVVGNPASVTHSYEQEGTYFVQAHAQDEDFAGGDPFASAWVSNELEIRVIPDPNIWIPTIDFEFSASGTLLRQGEVVSQQFLPAGVSVSTTNPSTSAVISSAGIPTNGTDSLGNVLGVASHDDGTIVFDFATTVMMDEVQLFNLTEAGTSIRLYGSSGELLLQEEVAAGGANALQTIALNSTDVTRMEITLTAGATIAAIVSCRDGQPFSAAPSRFFVVDGQEQEAFRYSASGGSIGEFSISDVSQARGVTTTTDGNPLYVVTTNKRVHVYDTNGDEALGSWAANGIKSPEGIATDGESIWIVDKSKDRVYFYAGAASRMSGDQNPTSSFKLVHGNRKPKGITTDGEFIWVVDDGTDKVFVYDTDGNWVNWWKLDAENSSPSGVTINPGQDGIWVVDRKDDRVYAYEHHTLSVQGSQQASSSFPLYSANNHPEGIADPSQVINIGDTVNETLAAGDTFDWTFSADAGDTIYTVFASLSGTQFFDRVTTSLVSPTGNVVYSTNGFRFFSHSSGPHVLNETGAYTLQMTTTASISFSFTLWDVPSPDVTTDIQFDQVYSGSIESPGAQDHYTFTGTADTEIFFDAVALDGSSTGGAVVSFVDPTGTVISSVSASRVFSLDHRVPLALDGQYTIRVRGVGADRPTYSFKIVEIPPPDIQAIAYGELAEGNIEVAGAVDQWVFEGTAGDNIFLDFVTLAGGDLRYTVTAPSGSVLFSGGGLSQAVSDAELDLNETGTYTITAQVAFGQSSTPIYSFVIYEIPPLVPQVALLNEPVTGTLVPGEHQVFLFNVNAGTEVVLDTIDMSNRTLGVQLQAPDGSFVTGRTQDDALLTLEQSGVYQVIVQRIDDSPLGNDARGEFVFRLQDVTNRGGGAIDSLGQRFYVGFQRNLLPLFGGSPDLQLAITSAVDTSGAIMIPGLNYFETYDVGAGQSTVIDVSFINTILLNDQSADIGIIVTAVDEVAVYGLNQFAQTTDGFTALPLEALSTDYRVMAYPNTVQLSGDGGSSFAIVATEDDTLVTITPSADAGPHLAGVPFTIALDEAQQYQLYASASGANGGANALDLTGTTITSTAPVSVFSGNTAAYVPAGFGAADHLVEQMVPLESWGTQFLTTPLATRTGGDTVRILADQDNTEVQIDGLLVATLSAGQVYEQIVTTAASISTSRPALVAQLSHGSTFDGTTSDPFMMLVPPFEQFQNAYTMTTPLAGIDSNYVNLIVPDAVVGLVELDGAPVDAAEFASIGSSGFSAATLSVSVGSHNFSSPEPIGVAIYGFDDFDSYGYFGGMSLAPVADVASLSLEPETQALTLNSQTTLTASVEDASGNGLAGIRVDFQIAGANPEDYFAFTDANGQASVQYTGTSVGLDTVTASAVGLSALGAITWLAAPPTVQINDPASGSELRTGTYLLSGSASTAIPGATIVEARVGDEPAAALDALGNFFAPIDVQAGLQSVTVEVTDSFGQTASQSVSFVGVAPSSDPASPDSTQDVTASADIRYSSTTYNRATNTLMAEMQLVGTGDFTLDPTIVARLDATNATGVTLLDPEAIADAGNALVLFDSEVPSQGLTPGSVTAPVPIAFANNAATKTNLDAQRFAPEFAILTESNIAPAFTSIPTFSAVSGVEYRYDAEAVDPNGQLLEYVLLSAPEAMVIDSTTGQVAWTPAGIDTGSHDVSVEVRDGRGGTAVQNYKLVVGEPPANRPPVISSIPGVNAQPTEDYQYQVDASDADGDLLAFSLLQSPADMSVNATTGLISFLSAPSGIYPVAVQVSDGRGGVAVQEFTLSVGAGAGVSAPVFTTTPVVRAVAESLYVYAVSATDDSGTALSYSLPTGPIGMQIDAVTGRLTWQPELFDVGNDLVQVQVMNAFGGTSLQTFNLETVPERPNVAPVFISSGDLAATVGEVYSYAAEAIDDPSQTLTFDLAVAPTGMQIDASSGTVTWNPTLADLGQHRVLLTVTDPLGAQGFQQFLLSVRNINVAPEFTTQPVDEIQAGDLYRYNAFAVDSEDDVRYELVVAPDAAGGMQIDTISGSITWQPGLADVGDHVVVVRATDDRGLSVDQAYTLTVTADLEAPTVDIVLSADQAAVGELVSVTVQATDNVGVETVELFNGTNPVVLVDGRATLSSDTPGFLFLTASVSDASGNTATDDVVLQIGDVLDDIPPVVVIESPSSNETVTYLTDVFATVSDPNLKSYRLEYSRLNDASWRTISEVRVTDGTPIDVSNQNIGTFDPTLLQNDEYQLRLTAEDLAGNIAFAFATLSLDGQAKLGNFRLEFTDLSIPLAGIPIHINRVYDTLDAGESMDFGFGWKLDIASPRIRETTRVSEAEAAGAGIFGANPFRIGTRVYMNVPDGRRVGFTFDPIVEPGLLGAIWRPRFIADPGVYHRLEVADVPLSQSADGTFGTYLTGFAYNPDTYTLITKDQLRYTYKQFDDIQLQSIVDRNEISIEVTPTGIYSSMGVSITWDRDEFGRISEIIDPSGNSLHYEYSANGDLLAFEDQSGHVTQMRYLEEPTHYLESVEDARGVEVLQLEFDEGGRLVAETDALGYSTTQSFDLPKNVEIIGDRLGNETILTFDDRGNITAQTDAQGNSTLVTYDTNDNTTSVTTPLGMTMLFTHDANGNVTSETDAAGNTWVAEFNDSNDQILWSDPLGNTISFGYDTRGNLVSFEDAVGGVTNYSLDEFGRPVAKTDARGFVTAYSYSPTEYPTVVTFPDGNTRRITYNQYQQPTEIVDERGNITTIEYTAIGLPARFIDALGQQYSYQYDSTHLISMTDPAGRVTSYEYDDAGNKIAMVAPDGGRWEYTYDARGSLLSEESPLGNIWTSEYDELARKIVDIDPLGFRTTYEYDDNHRELAIVDALGRRTSFEYDDANNRTAVLNPDGTRVTMTYDAAGRMMAFTDELGATTSYSFDGRDRWIRRTDALGGTTLREYDEEGNLASETDPLGGVANFEYDSRQRLIMETSPIGTVVSYSYDASGNPVSVTDPMGRTSLTDFDALNRLVSETDPLNGMTLYEYDSAGNLSKRTDKLGRVSTYTFDGYDRPLTHTDARGFTESFTWDFEGKRTSVTDFAGNQTSYVYDAAGRLVEEVNPLGHASYYAYDDVGNLAWKQDRNGRQTEFEYDARDRMIRETWLDANGIVNELQMTYNAIDNLTSVNDGHTSVTHQYDLLGRLSEAIQSPSSALPSLRLNYSYDAASRVVEMHDNQGVVVASEYDLVERLLSRNWSGFSGADSEAVVQFTYDASGLVQSIDRFQTNEDRVASSFHYDAKGRLEQLTHRAASDQIIAEYDFVRDLENQITSFSHEVAEDFEYDQSGQLLRSTRDGVAAESYEYDAAGNRSSSTEVIGVGNQVLSDAEHDYQYDLEGNLIRSTDRASGDEWRYEYDHRNRLVSGELRSSVGSVLIAVFYRYDGLDRRVERVVDIDGSGPLAAETEFYFYDGEHVWLDTNADGLPAARYLYGDQIDDILASWRDVEGIRWYLKDHVGTVRDIVDVVGAIVNHIEYDSFGSILSETNAASLDRFRYTGREWDSVIGLYYFRARWYDPSTGRFVSVDPVGFDGGDGNLYRYVGNAPLTNTDPTGNTAVQEYNVEVKSKTSPLITQQFKCVGEGIVTSLPTIVLTQGGAAIPDLSSEVVSCAILPVSAQVNKKLTKVILWIELKTSKGPKVVRMVARQTKKGISSFTIIGNIFECDGKPDSKNAGSALKGGSKYRKNALGNIFQRFVHHIFPKKDSKGSAGPQKWREILAGCCIGINDVINLISVDGNFHSTLHNKKLYDKMNKSVGKASAQGCTQVLKQLRKFKGNISKGKLPV